MINGRGDEGNCVLLHINGLTSDEFDTLKENLTKRFRSRIRFFNLEEVKK